MHEKMARGKKKDTKSILLTAAKEVILRDGYSGLSTRKVADLAGTQLSQIQYHFGSKDGLVLALYDQMNSELLWEEDVVLKGDADVQKKWARLCELFDADIKSGYVQVIHELVFAGWTNTNVNEAVLTHLRKWYAGFARLAEDAMKEGRANPIFTKEEIAALIGATLVGGQVQSLSGLQESEVPIRAALEKLGRLLFTAA